MLPMPYPPLKVEKESRDCANVLSIDYCGAVSEMTAINQYIHDENCLSHRHCRTAQIILGIAMAEMIHLQKLGTLILQISEIFFASVSSQRMLQYASMRCT